MPFSLLAPNEGLEALLLAMVGTPPMAGKLLVRLYQNDYTPSTASTLAEFEEADFATYRPYAVDWSPAFVTGGQAQITANTLIWGWEPIGHGNGVYGAYLVAGDGTHVAFAGRFPDAPVSMRSIGDFISLTLTMALGGCGMHAGAALPEVALLALATSAIQASQSGGGGGGNADCCAEHPPPSVLHASLHSVLGCAAWEGLTLTLTFGDIGGGLSGWKSEVFSAGTAQVLLHCPADPPGAIWHCWIDGCTEQATSAVICSPFMAVFSLKSLALLLDPGDGRLCANYGADCGYLEPSEVQVTITE